MDETFVTISINKFLLSKKFIILNKKTFDDSDIKKLLELKKQKNIIDVLNNEAMLYSQAHELDFSRIENIRFFHGIPDIPSKNLIIKIITIIMFNL